MTEVQQEVKDPFAEFDPRVREDVDGLIWLGHLEDEFDFCGHHFVLHTLKGDDELNAGLVAKEYTETFSQARAWAWAKISLALQAVDGDYDFCPAIGPDKRSFARARFAYCTSNWYWPLAEYIFGRYAELEARQLAALRAIESLSQGSPQNSTLFVGSSTEQGDSSDKETGTSIPSSTDS